MLEHIPAWLGRALSGRRAGDDKLVCAMAGMAGDAPLVLTSPAFADGARLPDRFTEDGAGTSPPLTWSGAPEGATLVLIVEDPDAPTPAPLVHAIVWGLAAPAGSLVEDALVPGQAGGEVGKNSGFKQGWMPPDPPTGHGEHRYVFQLFALAPGAPDPGEAPGRRAVTDAMEGRVIASSVLIGTYSRGETADVGPVGAAAPA